MSVRAERRRSERRAASITISLRVGGKHLPAKICDICIDSMLVEVATDLPIGTQVECMIPMMDSEIVLASSVVRIAGDGARPRVALMFRDITPSFVTALDFMVAAL